MTAGRLGDNPEPTVQVAVPVVPAAAEATGPGAGGSSAVGGLYDIDPDTVAALVTSCLAVTGLSGGPFGAAATYLPGRKVSGVQISQDTLEVHVVGRYGVPVAELAHQVRRALSGRVRGRRVDIVVEDLADLPGPIVLSGSTPPRTVAPSAGSPGQPDAPGSTSELTVGWPPSTMPPPPAVRPPRSTR